MLQEEILAMTEDVLASLPSSGMTLRDPEDCLELLRLCTVMNWKPKIPLHIMRDDSAGRWLMKGQPGAQDFWVRDVDIENLKKTPMWFSVQVAKPYGIEEKIKPAPYTATEISARERESWERVAKISEMFKDKIDKGALYKAMLEGVPLPSSAPEKITGKDIDNYFIIDDVDDPVETEKAEAAKARLAAEERIRKLDEWE
jgi:hypothetical protein